MSQVNVSLPPQLKMWIDACVADGRYSSASDYVRDLVRRDQAAVAAEERQWLRTAIADGLASGVVESDPGAVIEAIIAANRG